MGVCFRRRWLRWFEEAFDQAPLDQEALDQAPLEQAPLDEASFDASSQWLPLIEPDEE
jgi:hypothetical protein